MQRTRKRKITVERLLARARAAVPRAARANPLRDRLVAAAKAQPPARLEEFIVTDDREFLARAYLKILLRPPDAAGEAFFLGQLQTGTMTRLEVLYGLATADEAKGWRIPVAGLQALHWRLYRIPLLGWLRRRSGNYDRWLHLRPEGGRR